MNILLSSLADICEQHPVQEKIVIVPSYIAGHELCRALTKYNGGWANLYSETTTGLAQRITEQYLLQQNITLLTSTLTAAALENIFRKLNENNSLRYFKDKKVTAGLVNSIADAILELRHCGITSAALNENDFVDIQKGQDLVLILREFENYLNEYKYIDPPGLVSLAVKAAPKLNTSKNEKIIILPSFLNLTPVEHQLIELLSQGKLIKVNIDSLQEIHPCCSVSMFHAYGINNELKEIIRRVQQAGTPLDDVTIAYTNDEYIPALYSLSKRLGFNLTIAEGIPVAFTSPGRVLKAILQWIKQDYSAAVLVDLLISGDVKVKCKGRKKELPGYMAARLLRNSGIGWGRERYNLLKSLAQDYKDKANQETETEGQRSKYRALSNDAKYLHLFMQQLLEAIPVPDDMNRVDFRQLTSSLSDVMVEIVNIKADEKDAAALEGIVELLNQTGKWAAFEIELKEALERVEGLLSGYSVAPSASKPGHLHLVKYNNLLWSARSNTFIVGLNAAAFPGSGVQSPVLLDAEKLKINGKLPLGADKPKDNMNTMIQAIASRRGNLVLSCSSFDVAENRDNFPSNILLQVYRLINNDISLDYSHLIKFLGNPASYCPQEGKPALDETEWWINKILNQQAINGREVVAECYKGIQRGLQAAAARKSDQPTEYDGLIPAVNGELDPRRNKDIIMSCSRIETLASCPYAYFLKYVLGLILAQEVTHDPSRWLSNKHRGTFFHELFYQFMKNINEKVDFIKHQPVLHQLADQLIKKYKEKIPSSSYAVFEHEVRDIIRSCDIFLTVEEAHEQTPMYFEVPFGFGPGSVKENECGVEEPVEIDLGANTNFLLTGKIDRIDLNPDGTYSVWDYKTVSTYNYDDHKYLDHGRQIQHALYAIATEEIIKRMIPGANPKVEYSGYLFSTSKGAGQKYFWQQGDKAKVKEVLKHLFDILAAGAFVATDDEEMCNTCDYPGVCNRNAAVARAKELAASGCAHLNSWRRLKKFE